MVSITAIKYYLFVTFFFLICMHWNGFWLTIVLCKQGSNQLFQNLHFNEVSSVGILWPGINTRSFPRAIIKQFCVFWFVVVFDCLNPYRLIGLFTFYFTICNTCDTCYYDEYLWYIGACDAMIQWQFFVDWSYDFVLTASCI